MTKTVTVNKKDTIKAIAREERPHNGLTQIQEELAEFAADLLVSGGAREDTDMLLRALLRHQYRRLFGERDATDSSAEFERKVAGAGEWHLGNTYQQLSNGWPDEETSKAKEESNADARKSVVDIVRAGLRRQVKSSFEEFMGHMVGTEEAWLLNKILQDVVGCGDDMAEAFVREIDLDDAYVRVPWNFAKKTREFVDLLEKKVA